MLTLILLKVIVVGLQFWSVVRGGSKTCEWIERGFKLFCIPNPKVDSHQLVHKAKKPWAVPAVILMRVSRRVNGSVSVEMASSICWRHARSVSKSAGTACSSASGDGMIIAEGDKGGDGCSSCIGKWDKLVRGESDGETDCAGMRGRDSLET